MVGNDDGPLGWGLIGASDIAATYMVDAIRADADSRVVAVSSGSAARAAEFAADHRIPTAWPTHSELLADDRIDAVYISSVNALHRPQTIAAASAGKHVLCEKPIALSNTDAHEMVEACRAAGVVLGVNHHLRNASANRAAREAINAGQIGTPLSARAVQAALLPERLQTWRLNDEAAGAGVTLDITVHDVDLLRFLLDDEVVEVAALAANQGMAEAGIEDVVAGCLRFRSGLIASFHDAFNVPDSRTSVEIHGSEGSIVVEDAMFDDPVAQAWLRRGGQSRALEMEPQVDVYERGVAAFNRAVRGHGEPAATGRDGAKSLEIALAALESARTGATVAIGAVG